MRFEIVTIFPGFFTSIFENGIVRRALSEGLVEVGIHDLRAFTHDPHRTVDDRPFGGGEGMVLKPQPIAEAMESLGIGPRGAQAPMTPSVPSPSVDADFALQVDIKDGPRSIEASTLSQGTTSAVPKEQAASALYQGTTSVVPMEHPKEDRALAPAEPPDGIGVSRPTVILLSAQGRPFTQALARHIATLPRAVLICGRYEGVDERINELYCDMELSIGDYVLSGGELAAAVVIDATMRLIPGVLGNEASGEFESFGAADAEIETDVEGVPRSQHGAGGLLDYPHYTRPAEFSGLKVPEVLLNGDHLQIRRWRREQQLRKTLKNRPDLLENSALSVADKELLEKLRQEQGANDGTGDAN
jgi:tRNA (guanine37-N1)-methyltransferase